MNNGILQFTSVDDLKKITRLDVCRAIKNMGGKEQLYLSLVSKFYQAQHSLVNQLNELFINEEWDELFSVVHTLKTNTAYIGAFDLSARCSMVEKNLEQQNYHSSAFTQLVEELYALRDDFKVCVIGHSDQVLTAANKAAIVTLLESIKALLNTSNIDVKTRLPSLKAMVKNSEYEEDINILTGMIVNVEYEQSFPVIETLLTRIDSSY